MDVSIAAAASEDADAIAALLEECWAATYSSFLSPRTLRDVTREWHHPDLLRRQIENPDVAFLLARTGSSTLVGVANAKRVPGSDAVDVQRLYVHPSCQRRGIGSRLLRGLLAAFPEARRLELAVAELNPSGRAFWTRHGFQETGRDQVQMGADVLDLVKMSRRAVPEPNEPPDR